MVLGEILCPYPPAVSETVNKFSEGPLWESWPMLSNAIIVCNQYLPKMPADMVLTNDFYMSMEFNSLSLREPNIFLERKVCVYPMKDGSLPFFHLILSIAPIFGCRYGGLPMKTCNIGANGVSLMGH